MAPPQYTPKTTAEEIAENNKSAIAGKVVLVTGVTPRGLGASFVSTIASYSPSLIILAGRSVSASQTTASAIPSSVPTRILELDLSSQAQVRSAAAEVNAYEESIDVLVNNAGVMATPYAVTKDGLESQFGINHIGHFLFTNLIINKVLKGNGGKGGRVVSVSSEGYRLSPVRFEDWGFDEGKTYDKWRAYGQSKTANMLFAISLAEKLGSKGLVAASVHPGVIMGTNLAKWVADEDFADLQKHDRVDGNRSRWGGVGFKTMPEGTATHVFAAFDERIAEHNGAYCCDSQVTPLEKVRCWGRDKIDAERLWKLSEEIVGQKFEY